MKHKFIKIGSMFAMGAMMVIAASCAKEELDLSRVMEYGPSKQINVSAQIMTTRPEKAHMDGKEEDGIYKVYWDQGDQITVNNGVLDIIDIDPVDPQIAGFTGTASPNTMLEPGRDVYRSIYPASIINSIPADATPMIVTLPTVQSYNGSSDQIDNNYMAAYSSANASTDVTSVNLRYKNLCSVLKVVLKAQPGTTGVDAQVSRIRLTSPEGMSGDFEVTFNVIGNPVLTAVDGTPSNLTELVFSTPVDITTEKTFFIMVPPIQNKALVMQIWNGDGTKVVQQETASATLNRSFLYTVTQTANFQDWGGAISVSDNQKVYFAGGNLQHNFRQNKWRFAHEQYSILPDATRSLIVFPATLATSYADMDAKYAQIRNLDIWTDLFGWGTSGSNVSGALNYAPYNTLWGYNATTVAGWGAARYGFGYGPVSQASEVWNFSSDVEHSYLGRQWDWTNCDPSTHIPAGGTILADHNFFADWGFVNNSELNATISDPTKRAGTTIGQTWRTLSHNEWDYAYRGAKRIDIDGNYKCGFGRIDTTGNGDYANGFFFIPDKMHWFMMPQGLKLTPGTTATLFITNTYTYAQFKLLESYGVVFLPACGARTETIHHRNEIGFYWSSSSCPATTSYDGQPITAHQHAYSFKIYGLNNGQEHITSVYTENKFDGNAVRLVRNTTDQ